jgi:hypothetical protein
MLTSGLAQMNTGRIRSKIDFTTEARRTRRVEKSEPWNKAQVPLW